MSDDVTVKQRQVDITDTLAPMSLHKHILLPTVDVVMTLKPQEMEFLFSTLARVHSTLIRTIKDPKVTPEEQKSAYDFAYNIETIYSNLFEQLKLFKPERMDFN